MKVLRHDQPDFAEQLSKLSGATSLFDPAIEERVRFVIADVEARRDAALVELTERFDKVRLQPEQFRVTGLTPRVPADLQRAIAAAQRNIAAFARRSLRKDWWMRNAQGATVGERFEPFERV